MRTLFLFSLLLTSCLLVAQTDLPSTKGLFGGSPASRLQLSLNFTPRFDREIVLSGARVEVGADQAGNTFPALLDTVNVFGQERIFQATNPRAYFISPSDANFWFGTQFRAHYQIKKGFQLVGGIHYDRIRYTTRSQGNVLEGIINVIGGEVLYPVARIVDRNVGLTLHTEYHVRPERRFHPYVGMGLSGIVRQRDREVIGFAYTGDESRLLDPLTANVPQRSTVINIDFLFTGGLLYRVADDWRLGLTINSYLGGAGIIGAQVRYSL